MIQIGWLLEPAQGELLIGTPRPGQGTSTLADPCRGRASPNPGSPPPALAEPLEERPHVLRPCQHARTAHWGEPLPRCVPMRATGGSRCCGTRRPVMLGGWSLRAPHRRVGDLLFPTRREGHRQEMGLDIPQGRRGGAPGRTPCPPHHSGHSLVLCTAIQPAKGCPCPAQPRHGTVPEPPLPSQPGG